MRGAGAYAANTPPNNCVGLLASQLAGDYVLGSRSSYTEVTWTRIHSLGNIRVESSTWELSLGIFGLGSVRFGMFPLGSVRPDHTCPPKG